MTPLGPGEPVWDLSWSPPMAGWLEDVDDDGTGWVANHPPGADAGDQSMAWTAQLTELRSRTELTNPGDGYCRQCLEITASDGLVRCPVCGHFIHPRCACAHLAVHEREPG